MGWIKPQWTNLPGRYNGMANAPVYMKINKSVKRNINCTVLLLIPKRDKCIPFYDIIKEGGNHFYGINKTSELCFITLSSSSEEGIV